jgi:sensor domain CHASE-containing protein
MNLRSKTLIVIAVSFLIFIPTIYFFSEKILITGAEKLEKEEAYNEMERITGILYDEIYSLDETNYDWAAWDDTYEFIKNHNKDYIESNLVNSTFKALDINVILYFNSTGDLVYGKTFDIQNESVAEVPQEILNYIREHPLLIYHKSTDSNVSGIAVINGKAVLLASRPILTSNDEGPIRGALIMIRYFNERQLEEISKLSMVPLHLHILSGEIEKEKFVKILDKNCLAVFKVLKDINGKHAIMIEARLKRDIYRHEQSIINYFIFSLIFIAILTLFITFLLIEKTVTSRIVKLNKELNKIAESGDITKRIKEEGGDEIGELQKSINSMLDSIQKSRRKIEELLEKEKKMKAMVAHYFFNPIAIAKGYLQLYLESNKNEEVERALKAIDRIERVVKDIINGKWEIQ